MTTGSAIDTVLLAIGLTAATVEHVKKTYPTLSDIEDLFFDYAGDKENLRKELGDLEGTDFSKIDTRKLSILSTWHYDAIRQDVQNLDWKNFSQKKFVYFKRDLNRRTTSDTLPTAPSTTGTASPLDFSKDVLDADRRAMNTTMIVGSVEALKPHALWKSPFTATSTPIASKTFNETELVLRSDTPEDVISFYRQLVIAARTAEI